MTSLSREVEASHAVCRRVARRAGSNFYPAFLLLPGPKRRATEALYAYMRFSDDLGDGSNPLAERRGNLAVWRAMLQEALGTADRQGEVRPTEGAQIADTPRSRSACPLPDRDHETARRRIDPFFNGEKIEGPSEISSDQELGSAILPALVDTVDRFAIPPQYLFAVLEGVEMDLEVRTYQTFGELAEYCQRVASAVGLACIHIWGFHNQSALEPARKCGIAFQLTNILRDLQEDAARGRIYLPLTDLRQAGYSAEDLLAGRRNEGFDRVLEMEIDRARSFYHEAAELINWLEPDGRRIFGMMYSIYYRLLDRIAQRRQDLLRSRIGLGRWDKLLLALRWLFLSPQRTSLP